MISTSVTKADGSLRKRTKGLDGPDSMRAWATLAPEEKPTGISQPTTPDF